MDNKGDKKAATDGETGYLLVVDDNEMNRDMLSRRLSRRGHRVATAEDGQKALDMIAAEPFDVVLLDIMMPGIDGLEVLQKVRETRSASDLPIIMATAKDESSDVVDALKLGANDYVTKPLDFPVVQARVTTQLSLKRAKDELNAAHQRIKRDLEAAARVQQMLLPREAPNTDNVRFAWLYRPCDELAGDALNVFRIDDRHIGLYVLDVTGHGVQASLLSVTVTRALSPRPDRSSLVTRPIDDPPGVEIVPPAQVVEQLNRIFPMEDSGQFITLVYGILDLQTNQFRFTCAGHPAPFHARPDGLIASEDVPGLPIGIVADAEYEETVIQLAPRDRLILYSDGLLEEPDPDGEQFGSERSRAAIADGQAMPLDQSINLICEKLIGWHGNDQLKDDLTIVGVEFS